MARLQSTGQLRASFVPTISNIAAPTTTEIAAGTDLTPRLKRDGITTPKSGKAADVSDISTGFDKQAPGTYGGDAMTIKAYRDSTGASDTVWTTLVPPSSSLPNGTAGYIVIRRFGGSTTAFASADKVEVWPVSVISREMDPPAANEGQSTTIMLAVTAEPNDGAVIP
jgi:hypothetical protein